MPGFDISDFNVPPVGNPRGIIIFRTGISFDSESQIRLDCFFNLTNFINPSKI